MNIILQILISPWTLLKWILSLFSNIFLVIKALISASLILAIPVTNLIVWKNNKLSLKTKYIYVSTTSIIIGFILLLVEIKHRQVKISSSSLLPSFFKNEFYDRELNIDDSFEGIERFYGPYDDWTIIKTSKNYEISLPKAFTHQESFRIVIDMPDELLRDASVFKSLKIAESNKNKVSKKSTSLIQIQKFGIIDILDSKREAYVSDIPFLGASIKMKKIRENYHLKGQTILWIRENAMNSLELKKLEYVIKEIQNDPDLQKMSIVLTTGNNKLSSKLKQNFLFSIFTFYSCYSRREEKVLDFYEEKLAEALNLKDKLEIERQAKYFLEYLDQDFFAMKHFAIESKSYKSTIRYIRDVLTNVKGNMKFLQNDPLRNMFLQKVAVRMTSGHSLAKNRWLDYADIYEVEYSRNLDEFLKKSLDDGILVQNENRYRFRLGSLFRVFYEAASSK